ncbi:LPXTG cell wall anchor domain-containing protein [Haloglycomyces albus]|uniref:LPXTG cell wall anchor domain-containing protein n=1 Tax=Haloglycomyces albus TaxID=526067 RepID=UPI00146F9D4F|nr:LPXTG cell wall anchor domain-containing protein [Haloglycomyces albus]
MISFAVDGPPESFAVTEPAGSDECIEADNSLSCAYNAAAADPTLYFEVEASEDLEPGSYPYTATVQWGEHTLLNETETFNVSASDSGESTRPFIHGEFENTDVQAGETVNVETPFRLDGTVPQGPNVVAIRAGAPFSPVGMNFEGASPVADYDNCKYSEENHVGTSSVVCYVPDVDWTQGATYSIDDETPLSYEIADNALGSPWNVCACSFSTSFIDQETVDNLTVDLEGDNQLEIKETDISVNGDHYDADWYGLLRLTVSDNPYDLEVSPVNIEGDKGDTVDVTIPVTNNGPAKAIGTGATVYQYRLPVQLPSGVEVDEFNNDRQSGNFCESDFGQSIENDYGLEEYDLMCFFSEVEVGGTAEVEFSVTISDAESTTDGAFFAINANSPVSDSGYEDNYDNNSAVIGLNSPDVVKNVDENNSDNDLPVTGSALTYGIIGGAAALLAGAVLFFVARRRSVS